MFINTRAKIVNFFTRITTFYFPIFDNKSQFLRNLPRIQSDYRYPKSTLMRDENKNNKAILKTSRSKSEKISTLSTMI